MRDGRILQVDSPQQLYRAPANLFVAGFIGTPSMNLVDATISDDQVAFGQFRLPLARERRPTPIGDGVVLGIRPEAFEDTATARPGLPTIEVTPVVV